MGCVQVCKGQDTCIYPKYGMINTSYHIDIKQSVDIHTTCTLTPPVHHKITANIQIYI